MALTDTVGPPTELPRPGEIEDSVLRALDAPTPPSRRPTADGVSTTTAALTGRCASSRSSKPSATRSTPSPLGSSTPSGH